MNLFLAPRQADWLIRRGHWVCLGGAVLVVLAVTRFRDAGFVTGFMVFLFGGLALSFRAWLTERGLWMLATIGLVVSVALYGAMQRDALKLGLNGQNPRLVWLAFDTAVAASVVWLQVRLLATVIRVNRALPPRARAAVLLFAGRLSRKDDVS